jgi:MFS family permease
MSAAAIYYAVFGVAPEEGVQGFSTWRIVFLVGILPALLAVLIRRRLKEPDEWLKAKETARAAQAARGDEFHRQIGDLREMFGSPRWRYHTLIGVLLAVSGVMGLWGVAFFTPELVRSFVPKDQQNTYVPLTSFLQNFGAFFGIYGFGVITGLVGRRLAFLLSFLLAFVSTIAVFGFMRETWQIWWMIPLLGFSTLTVFGGYAIYFPELYPTRLRSSGVGFCYNVARYLAAAAPFFMGTFASLFTAPEGSQRAAEGLSYLSILSSLGSVDTPFRYATIALCAVFLIGILVIPFAPETKGKPLPE